MAESGRRWGAGGPGSPPGRPGLTLSGLGSHGQGHAFVWGLPPVVLRELAPSGALGNIENIRGQTQVCHLRGKRSTVRTISQALGQTLCGELQEDRVQKEGKIVFGVVGQTRQRLGVTSGRLGWPSRMLGMETC